MKLRIHNNGAGIQSTALFLMMAERELPCADYSIFADTGEEPQAIYTHLEWLKSIPRAPRILVGSAGKLGDDLVHGRNSTGGRFAAIPAYTHVHHTKPRSACEGGMTRRQCTKEYKVEVIDRVIRRDILGLKPRQRIPAGTQVTQIIGISWDERRRAEKIKARFEAVKWATPEFPLIDMRMTRHDCLEWLEGKVPHAVERSACVFCPYKTNSEWLKLKNGNPADWARAVEIDEALRTTGAVANRDMNLSLYLHRKCLPLVDLDLEKLAAQEETKKATPLFALLDCGEGMCGV